MWPEVVSHTKTEPSMQPISRKSSWGRHLMMEMGLGWRFATRCTLRSRRPTRETEWSAAMQQTEPKREFFQFSSCGGIADIGKRRQEPSR